MQGHTAKQAECRLAPGLARIIDAAEAAGWSVTRAQSQVDLLKPAGRPEAPEGYQINSRWWCRDLSATPETRAFRVTAPDLYRLLGLPWQPLTGDQE
jgi:hypothetical protein